MYNFVFQRVVETAENLVLDSVKEKETGDDYYNAKMLKAPGTLNASVDPKGTREMLLTRNSHFFQVPVNTTFSAVHVPTNVYDKGKNNNNNKTIYTLKTIHLVICLNYIGLKYSIIIYSYSNSGCNLSNQILQTNL